MARECEDMAKSASDERLAEKYLKLAEQWKQVAAQAERLRVRP